MGNLKTTRKPRTAATVRPTKRKSRKNPASTMPPRIRARQAQLRRKVIELAALQDRLERAGDHAEAETALRERRYFELVHRLLLVA